MTLPSFLRSLHQALGARFQGEPPTERIERYGDSLHEDRALHEGCGLFDRSDRGLLQLTGSERATFLQGFTTNDLRPLGPGRGAYTAFLTPKAQLIADARVLVRPSELLVDTEPDRQGPVREFLDRHLISEDVEIVDATGRFALFSFLGPRSAQTLQALLGGPPSPLEENAFDEREGLLVVGTRLGSLGGFDLFVPLESARSLLEKAAALATPVGFVALETARVEAGIPRFGADMGEQTSLLEASLTERAVSFTKGCYVGQEALARSHHAGSPRRKLVGLHLEAAPDLPERGAPLFKAAGDAKSAGEVTTAVLSPRFGAIALGYVRREHQVPGTELVTAQGRKAVVCVLPMAAPRA